MLIDDQMYISKFSVSLLSRIMMNIRYPEQSIKFMDTERRRVVARGQGGGNGELLFDGH